MSEFSRETLLNIIETDHVQCGEASALARMALAAMDSEPVIVVGDDGGDALSYRRLIQSFESGTKLYRHAQPAPVVPDERDKTVDADDHPLLWSFNEGWNACRAAMLAAAQHDTPALNSVQNVVTVPGTWIPVSERMPLTPSADCEYSDIEVNVFDGERVFTAHYATGSQPQPWGCWVDTYAKITHWQPLPAAQQEVSDA
ncbi:TPA: DUF551 domain-containing protein [Klebsiella pneumoniae]|nr:DUF551 domain-containing protein [Klebsiella pneumoniae]